jgi:hypothetical protein
MGIKSFAILAAACAAAAVPCSAQEMRTPMTTFFMELPLDARSPREQMPNFGLQLQGSRPYQSLRIDQKTLNFLPALGGIEATWIVAGAVGVAAVASIAHKDKGTSQQMAEQKQQQLEACPVQCAPQ